MESCRTTLIYKKFLINDRSLSGTYCFDTFILSSFSLLRNTPACIIAVIDLLLHHICHILVYLYTYTHRHNHEHNSLGYSLGGVEGVSLLIFRCSIGAMC